jgi:type II secretory pathway pseudopilin PulG
MKLTHQHHAKRKAGMTLLELTVVILVLLSLIAILFVGARAWKRGSDRAANIMNIRNVQQAMRGHENMYNMRPGDTLASTVIVGDDEAAYLRTPRPPANLPAYTYSGTVPIQGVLYVTNNFDHVIYGFTPPEDGEQPEYADW